MNFIRTVRYVCAAVIGLGVLSVPLAFAYASVSVSIQSLSPSTSVTVGTPVSFNVSASGFTSPMYSINDIAPVTTIGSGNIDASGNFTWTPTSSDIGTHNLTITVSDSSGNTATTQEQLVVSAASSVSIQSLSPSSSINSGNNVSFTASASGFTNPVYSVSDSFSGSSVSNSNINSSGNFSWTPTSNDTGTHAITVTATDSAGHTASTVENITVGSAAAVTIQSLSPGTSVTSGTNVSFTASPSGLSNPSYSLSDSFNGTSVSNSDINASGFFSWTPSSTDAGTHNLTLTAIDSSGHTATASLAVTVAASGTTSTASTLASLQAQLQVLLAELSALQGTAPASSTSGDGYVFNNFLGVGSTGTDVTELQTRLTALGDYSGPITGYFGSLTQAGVEQFQGTKGIEQVGYVGPATRAALNQ